MIETLKASLCVQICYANREVARVSETEGLLKIKLYRKTIPQSPSATAPFAQGSLTRRYLYIPKLFAKRKKLHCVEDTTSLYRRYNFTDEVNFTATIGCKFTLNARTSRPSSKYNTLNIPLPWSSGLIHKGRLPKSSP